MAQKFAVSGQHYLFDVQAFAHTILALDDATSKRRQRVQRQAARE